MIAKLIRFSIQFRGFVLVVAGLLLLAGGLVANRTPVDVLPDLTAPSVTVLTEATGFAPEEMELLVTFPLESVLNGAPGVRRFRTSIWPARSSPNAFSRQTCPPRQAARSWAR
jgi:Cu/Ag efflux pump CusA